MLLLLADLSLQSLSNYSANGFSFSFIIATFFLSALIGDMLFEADLDRDLEGLLADFDLSFD